MTPARRREATPASKGPRTTAPDPPSVPTKEGTELRGPDGAPTNQDAPTETGQVGPKDPPTKQSPRRSRGRNPLPVWPD